MEFSKLLLMSVFRKKKKKKKKKKGQNRKDEKLLYSNSKFYSFEKVSHSQVLMTNLLEIGTEVTHK